MLPFATVKPYSAAQYCNLSEVVFTVRQIFLDEMVEIKKSRILASLFFIFMINFLQWRKFETRQAEQSVFLFQTAILVPDNLGKRDERM
jgi:hypothetical protein